MAKLRLRVPSLIPKKLPAAADTLMWIKRKWETFNKLRNGLCFPTQRDPLKTK